MRKVLSADEPPPFLRSPPHGDLTPEQIRKHYLVEKGLARQLASAEKEDRRILYNKLYDELFERIPFHPQILKKQDPNYSKQQLQSQIKLLRRFFDKQKVLLEIGAGDCALSRAVADHFRLVYAVDVSEQISRGNESKENVRFALSDGTSIPVPAGTVNLAYSNQLMEHLHPDDAIEQLRNIYVALAPGGSYLCITPSRLSGPHDVSRYFDEVATGFHLKEYISSELRQMFSDVGFTNWQVLIGIAGQYRRLPAGNFFHSVLEGSLRRLSHRLRQKIVSLSPVNSALGLVCIAQKPGRS